jgi:hypothetical protein
MRWSVKFVHSVFLASLVAPLFLAGCSAGNSANNHAQKTTPATANLSPQHELRSRHEFANAFAQIKEGMSAEQVEAILGEPEDIRTQTDPGGISYTQTREIWGYGTDSHLGFATLGTITIDVNNHVQYLSGTSGADDLVAQLGEPKLRRLLRLLARTGGAMLDGNHFNPRDTIAAVNALQPLGKQIGVAVLDEYLQVSFGSRWGDDEGIILVMRALFDVPPSTAPAAQTQPSSPQENPFVVVHPGFFRPPMLGAADWYPDYPTKFPLFPLVIVDDIPLLPIRGYSLAGQAESPQEHLSFLKQARWRSQLLRPTNDPLGTWAKLMAMIPPDQKGSEREVVATQLLALIDTVYRPASMDDDNQQCDKLIASFPQDIQKVKSLGIRWNAELSCYVRADGSTLPPVIKPLYQRAIFEPHWSGYPATHIKVIVERQTPKRADLTIELNVSHGPAPACHWRIMRLSDSQPLLTDEQVNDKSVAPSADYYWSSSGYQLYLDAGKQIQIELSIGSEQFKSPMLRP